MSKKPETARGRTRAGAARAAGRRVGSAQYEVTETGRAIRELGRGSRQVTHGTSPHSDLHHGQRFTHSRREAVKRAAKIVVRLHRDALKELEKY
jgi:hypothetical protein